MKLPISTLERNLIQYQGVPDETEFLEIGVFPLRWIIQMVLDSEIRDSMTILAVLLAARQFGQQDCCRRWRALDTFREKWRF